MGNLLTADPAAPGKSLITSIPITSGQIAGTNTVTGAAVVGVTSSAGAGDSGKIPKLNASGLIDPSMLSGGGAGDIIILQDQKSDGTAGGTFTTGAWRTRDLNTEVVDSGGNCTLASNQFTLNSGTYRIQAFASCRDVDMNVLRLQNITDSSTTVTGMSIEASSGQGTKQALLFGRFTIAASKVFELQHLSGATKATNGFGYPASLGLTEIYSTVILVKEA